MSVVQIDIGAYGFDEAERGMIRLLAMLTDLRPFWPLLVPVFVGWMKEQFDSEGGWGADGWEPLSVNYAAWKSQHYPGKGILIAEGDLRRAASMPRRIATPKTLSLFIDDDVAVYHQEGTPNMPARPIIPEELPPHAQQQVHDVAEAWVVEMTHRLGIA